MFTDLMSITPEDISMFEDDMAQYGIPGPKPTKRIYEDEIDYAKTYQQLDTPRTPDSEHSGDGTLDEVDDSWRSDPDWLPAGINQIADKDEEILKPCSPKRTKVSPGALTENEKKDRRKNLNRLAAQRCRRKRKSRAEELEIEADELIAKNADLKKQLEELTEKKEHLYDIIKVHFQSCHGSPSK